MRLTPFTTPDDFPAPCPGWEKDVYGGAGIERPSPCTGADRRGKFTHPAAAPSAVGDPARADLLAVYAPGAANHNGIYAALGTAFPRVHGEIVLIPDGEAVPVPPASQPGRPPQLVTVVAEDGWNLQWPRPVVTWRQLYGVDGPAAWPALSGRRHPRRAAHPRRAVRAPRQLVAPLARHGAVARPLLRGPRPVQHRRRGAVPLAAPGGRRRRSTATTTCGPCASCSNSPPPTGAIPTTAAGSRSLGGERMRILGEIPVRKPGAARLLRPDGSLEDDTSFLARIPADVSVTFQALDRRGMVLNMAQTWHQVRAGEARYDCGGCHAHSKEPLAFAATAAARPTYAIPDLARSTPLLTLDAAGRSGVRTVAAHQVTVEWFRDVEPILERRCASCHGGSQSGRRTAARPLHAVRAAGRHLLAGGLLPPRARHLRRALAQAAGGRGAVVAAAAHPLPAGVPVAAEPADVESLGRAPGRPEQRGARRRPRLRPLHRASRRSGGARA